MSRRSNKQPVDQVIQGLAQSAAECGAKMEENAVNGGQEMTIENETATCCAKQMAADLTHSLSSHSKSISSRLDEVKRIADSFGFNIYGGDE